MIRVKRHTGKTRQEGEDLAEGEARADYSFRSIPKQGVILEDMTIFDILQFHTM